MELSNAEDGFSYLDGEKLMADGGGEMPENIYADDTPLDRAFPESPKANVLAALVSEEGNELNESELEEISGVKNAGEHADYLDDELGLVDAEDNTYAMNTDHPGADALVEFEAAVLDDEYLQE